MGEGRYTPLDWCNALTASDSNVLEQLCQSPEARLCVNDTYLFQIDMGNLITVNEIPSPLIYAIDKDVSLNRIQTLVDKGGARATTQALHFTYSQRYRERKELFLFLVSRGARYDFWTFQYHVDISATEEEKIQIMQRHLKLAKNLTDSTEYAPLVKLAQQRRALAQNTALAIVGLHRKGPRFQNKDVLRIIARQVKGHAHSSLWKPPPVPWWKKATEMKREDEVILKAAPLFLIIIFLCVIFRCNLIGREDGICWLIKSNGFEVLDYLFPVAAGSGHLPTNHPISKG